MRRAPHDARQELVAPSAPPLLVVVPITIPKPKPRAVRGVPVWQIDALFVIGAEADIAALEAIVIPLLCGATVAIRNDNGRAVGGVSALEGHTLGRVSLELDCVTSCSCRSQPLLAGQWVVRMRGWWRCGRCGRWCGPGWRRRWNERPANMDVWRLVAETSMGTVISTQLEIV